MFFSINHTKLYFYIENHNFHGIYFFRYCIFHILLYHNLHPLHVLYFKNSHIDRNKFRHGVTCQKYCYHFNIFHIGNHHHKCLCRMNLHGNIIFQCFHILHNNYICNFHDFNLQTHSIHIHNLNYNHIGINFNGINHC